MEPGISRRRAIQVLAAGGIAPLALTTDPLQLAARLAWAATGEGGDRHDDEKADSEKRSRYGLQFTHSLDQLIGDLEHGERGDPRRESHLSHDRWYSRETRKRFGAWGPEQRLYEPLAGLDERSLVWKRERVIATAARFIGYGYQHHHVPDWDPPADWPWKPCCVGHNGKGVDCSNLTTFVYNQGFGIHMSSGIERQSETNTALENYEGRIGVQRTERIAVQRVELPDGYDQRLRVLHTGDLVYIRGREDGPVTHVVLWLASVGHSASGVPLVMDSHGGDVNNDEGRPIPCGIHLRPFREDSWYNRCASHAHRIFR